MNKFTKQSATPKFGKSSPKTSGGFKAGGGSKFGKSKEAYSPKPIDALKDFYTGLVGLPGVFVTPEGAERAVIGDILYAYFTAHPVDFKGSIDDMVEHIFTVFVKKDGTVNAKGIEYALTKLRSLIEYGDNDRNDVRIELYEAVEKTLAGLA